MFFSGFSCPRRLIALAPIVALVGLLAMQGVALAQPEEVAIAILNEREEPEYFYGDRNNSCWEALDTLEAMGLTADVITSEDIVYGALEYASILILPDNVPSERAVLSVIQWWEQGGFLIAVDSAISFVLYAGILFPELAGLSPLVSEGIYWGYESGDQVLVESEDPLIEDYGYASVLSAASGDALLYSDALPYTAEILASDVSQPERAAIVVYRGKGTLLFIGPDEDIAFFPGLLFNAAQYAYEESSILWELNDAISAAGADWTAGTTSVSGLTEEEQSTLCGANEEYSWNIPNTTQEVLARATRAKMATVLAVQPGWLPEAFDWRTADGFDWTTPIKNQGNCGSCVAFATLGAFESILKIDLGIPFIDPDLSEEFLFFCGGGECIYGWLLTPAADFLVNTGVPYETCWPYRPLETGCAGYCGTWDSEAEYAWDYYVLDTIDEMKQSLVEHGPLLTRMEVYEDFFSYRSGVYRHVWGAYAGGHAVTIVGYDDLDGCWIVKNSWGTGWGENGWFRIGYGEVGIDLMAYEIWADPIVGPSDPGSLITVESRDGNLWIGNEDGSYGRWIMINDGDDSSPAISPDGNLIAWASDWDPFTNTVGDRNILIMPIDGSGGYDPNVGLRVLDIPGNQDNPTWTWDGDLRFLSDSSSRGAQVARIARDPTMPFWREITAIESTWAEGIGESSTVARGRILEIDAQDASWHNSGITIDPTVGQSAIIYIAGRPCTCERASDFSNCGPENTLVQVRLNNNPECVVTLRVGEQLQWKYQDPDGLDYVWGRIDVLSIGACWLPLLVGDSLPTLEFGIYDPTGDYSDNESWITSGYTITVIPDP